MASVTYEEQLLLKLKAEHEKFAHEIILKLKYHYKLHEDESCPTNVVFASSNICEAIFALSYVFRYHFRGVYYFLHNELIDSKEFEKYCLSLPVERSKRYTFNFLLRLSLVFEISMYLFKEGYDYFHIAHKCIASYPDLAFFHANGGWDRVNLIACYIIKFTETLKVKIAAEHPLLGTFIETTNHITEEDEMISINHISQDCLEIDQMIKSEAVSIFSEEFFNPMETQSLKVLYKYFIAPQTPKFKYKNQDLLKIHETFPLCNRVPFEVKCELSLHYYIVYNIYVEKQEIHYYLCSYMDPEVLKRDFSIQIINSQYVFICKDENLGNNSEYFSCNFSNEEIEEELSKLESQKDSLLHKYESFHSSCEEKLENNLESFSSEQEICKSDYSKGSHRNIKFHKSMESSCEIKEVNETTIWTGTNHEQSLSEEISLILQSMSLSDTDNTKSVIGNTELENQEISKIPEKTSSLMDLSRLSKENKEILISALPTNPEMKCFALSFLKNMYGSIQQSTERGLSTIITNMSYISTATKYLFFKMIGDCSDLSIEERNGLFRRLVNILDNIVAEKTNLFQIINNMCDCTDQQKSDLIKCIIQFSKEECNELQINEIHHNSLYDLKMVDAFEGIFKNEDDISSEFEQFMMLCQNHSEIDIDELKELISPLEGIEYSKKIMEGKHLSKQASTAKSMPKQFCQEKNKPLADDDHDDDDDDDDDHTICRCFEKGNVASGTSSPKLLNKHCQKSEVPNSSSNRQRRKNNKKSKRRSKK